jgi:hypothetical protein
MPTQKDRIMNQFTPPPAPGEVGLYQAMAHLGACTSAALSV